MGRERARLESIVGTLDSLDTGLAEAGEMLELAAAAERRAVSVGAQFGDDLQILSGLAAGERVVVEGGEGIEDGTRVKETDS